jgi:hypothetical protein
MFGNWEDSFWSVWQLLSGLAQERVLTSLKRRFCTPCKNVHYRDLRFAQDVPRMRTKTRIKIARAVMSFVASKPSQLFEGLASLVPWAVERACISVLLNTAEGNGKRRSGFRARGRARARARGTTRFATASS